MLPCKILMAVSSLSAGGAERMASELVNHWASRGWEVGLLTLSDTGSDHYMLNSGVERIGLDLMWESRNPWQSVVSNLHRSRMIRRSVEAYGPHLVVSFAEQTNVRVLAALLGTGIPIIVSERIDPRMHWVGRSWHAARRVLYPLSAAVVVQTDLVAAWAKRRVPKSKVWVIPNFVRHLPEPPPFFADRKRLILGMGRLDPQKGFDLLLRAFAASRAVAQGWRLVILGEGPERGRLEAIIAEQRLQGQVELPGVAAEPADWLGQTRVFMLPSRYEGFPNALLEAMAMGCAAVATDCLSGPAEIISNRQNGLLVPVNDIGGVTAALDSLTENPIEAEKLASEATKVRDRFAPERVLAQWDKLIISVLEDKGRVKHKEYETRIPAGRVLRP
jgi:GalNAc-alpha-(1->4)-GalNAc-alpha-(1->3)-diNAcBac-PP-undecaprenol alpha-1,4-N-acetyl-D-galactosaminyltransferase